MTFLVRLKEALGLRHRGHPATHVVVERTDLSELVNHFERLDSEVILLSSRLETANNTCRILRKLEAQLQGEINHLEAQVNRLLHASLLNAPMPSFMICSECPKKDEILEKIDNATPLIR